MVTISGVFITILCVVATVNSAGRVVCYFPNWTIYTNGNGQYGATNVDPNLCTHILYAFVGLNEDGTVDVLDDWEATGLHEIAHLVSLKQQNPDLKIILSMGGWNEGSSKYSRVAANPSRRSTLVNSVLQYIDDNGFDGFDLDWEYPGQREGDADADPANYVTLLGELKSALNDRGYILSVAVSGGVVSTDLSYDVQGVSDNVDLINVMTYDIHGDWDNYVGHHAPLYPSHLDRTEDEKQLNVDAGIKHWLEKGADPSKINLGIGFYGRSFTLANASNTELYAPIWGPGEEGPYTSESGILGYNEICEFDGDWEYVWDDEQKVPHKVGGNQWVGYEDPDSITIKVNYAKDLSLGGIMIWSLDTDDFLGICGGGKYPLLQTINDVLNE